MKENIKDKKDTEKYLNIQNHDTIYFLINRNINDIEKNDHVNFWMNVKS